MHWSEEGFAARDPSRPAVRVHGGWGQEDPDRLVRRFALDGASLVEHRESEAGRAWREVVWVLAEETGVEGRLLLATETGAGTFHLLAEGPADTMTGLARTLAGPVTWGLEAP